MRGVMEEGRGTVCVCRLGFNKWDRGSNMLSMPMAQQWNGQCVYATKAEGSNPGRRWEEGEEKEASGRDQCGNTWKGASKFFNRQKAQPLPIWQVKKSDAGTFHSNLSPSASCSSSSQPCFPLGYFFFHRSSRLPIWSLLNLTVTRKKGGEGGDLADKSTETKVNKCRWSACC